MSFWSQKTAAIGQKKYGLVKKQGSALQPQSAAVSAMFGGADDDEPRDAKQEVAQQMRDLGAAQRRRAAQQAAQAASIDPSIYDYDGVYDRMKEDERKKISARSGLSNTNHAKPGARYIGSLKQAAKVREREFDRVYERQLLKEQEQDKDTYGDTERFVTAAYKKQLQESRKWDAEDRRMDEVEERTSAQTSGMAGFYSNLLTRNIAAGADVEKAAVSSYTHGSRRSAVARGRAVLAGEQLEERLPQAPQRAGRVRVRGDVPALERVEVVLRSLGERVELRRDRCGDAAARRPALKNRRPRVALPAVPLREPPARHAQRVAHHRYVLGAQALAVRVPHLAPVPRAARVLRQAEISYLRVRIAEDGHQGRPLDVLRDL